MPIYSLLGKAANKLLQANSEDLIELLIDDLLEEMVLILNVIEEKNNQKEMSQRINHIMQDYVEEYKDYF